MVSRGLIHRELGGPPAEWTEAFAWLAWRLHPPQSIAAHKARAMNAEIASEQRDLALTAIAFNKDRAAADAMVEIATSGPEDLRHMADWWVRNRDTNHWRAYKPAERLPAKEAQTVEIPTVTDGPLTDLPPVAEIAAMKGDAAKGKALYNGRGTCFACHAVAGKGGQIGPDLTAIGTKFGADVLLTAMIEPSAGIAFGYESSTITTKDGRTHSGFIVADGDVVVLKDLAGQQHAIDKSAIKSRVTDTQSIMPSVRALGLSAQDLADLTAYLQSLRN